MRNSLLIIKLILLFSVVGFTQSYNIYDQPTIINNTLKVGPKAPNSGSALFEVVSTEKGSIPCPNMTLAEMGAISDPDDGLCIFPTDAVQNKLKIFDGANWGSVLINTGNDNIQINGNTISSTDTDGDITLDPNGTGTIELSADTNVAGNIGVSGTVDGRDVAADGSTLDSLNTILGDITEEEADQIENIGATVIGSSQWAHVGGMDQGVATTDTPSFDGLSIDGNIDVTGTVDGRDVADDGSTLDSLDTILGDITEEEADQIENIGDTTTIDATQWGYLGELDQPLKTTDTPTFDGVNSTGPLVLEEESTTPSSPDSGKKKLYPKDDGRLYTLDSDGFEQEVGTGTGEGVNYISNGTAEKDTSGWTTYDDGTEEPDDGEGGTPAVQWSRVTTGTPLAGTASFHFVKGSGVTQGQGVAYPFSIEPENQGQLQEIVFSHQPISGTYATGDLKIYILHVGSGNLIDVTLGQEIPYYSGARFHKAEFTTVTGDLDYLLLVHQSSTTSSAFTIAFDSIKIRPSTNIGTAKSSLYVMARLTGGQTVTSGNTTTLVWDTEDTDTANAYNNSNGVFTAPYNAYCEFTAAIEIINNAYTNNSQKRLKLYKNGSEVRGIGVWTAWNSPNSTPSIRGSAKIKVLAGDTVDIRLNAVSENFIVSTDNTRNYLDISCESESGTVHTTDQSDFGWKTCTMSVGGSTSAPTKAGTLVRDECRYRKVGDTMDIMYNYSASGTGSAGSGTYLFPIPGGESIDTSKLSVDSSGNVIAGPAQLVMSITIPGHVYPYDSTHLAIRAQSNSSGRLDTSACNVGSSCYGMDVSNMNYSFRATVPILNWKTTNRAQQLVNSVLSSYEGVKRVEDAVMNCGGSSNVLRQMGSWITHIGNVSSGACAITIATGVFSGTPYCNIDQISHTNPALHLSVTHTSATSLTVDCDDNTTSPGTDCTSYDFILSCRGPK